MVIKMEYADNEYADDEDDDEDDYMDDDESDEDDEYLAEATISDGREEQVIEQDSAQDTE